MLKISFDFDSTLSLKKIKQLFNVFDRDKVELFVVTSRCSALNDICNQDMIKIIKELNVDYKNVFLTQGAFKCHTLNMLNINIHFDDMPDEIMHIQHHCNNTLGILVTKDIIGDMNYLSMEYLVKSNQVDHKSFN